MVQSLERDLNAAKQALSASAAEFKRLPTPIDTKGATENGPLLQQTQTTLAQWISEIQTSIAGFQSVFADPVKEKPLGQYFTGIEEWRARKESHGVEYEKAKTRAAAHEETLQQIQTLEAQLAELNDTADTKSQQLARLGEPSVDFNALRTQWKTAHRNRADLLEQQCNELTAISKSRLRAVLQRATDIVPLAERLKQLLKGTKTRGERIDNLVEQVSAANDPLEAWHSILDELQDLAWGTGGR
jgi:DNA repair exonuclease SbcCD ATPase subunit